MRGDPSSRECPSCHSRNLNRIPRRGLMRFLPGSGAYLCRDCGTAFHSLPGKGTRPSTSAQTEKGLAARQLALERREQEFAERVAALEEQREAARMRLSRQEDAARHFQQAAGDLQKENEHLKVELFELRALNTALEARLQERESESAPDADLQPLRDRIAALEAENETLRTQVAGEATHAAHARESFGEKEAALHRELAQVRGDCDALRAELAAVGAPAEDPRVPALLARAEAAESERDRLGAECQAAEQRTHCAEEALAKANATVRDLRDAVAGSQEETARLLEQVSGLEARLAELARRPPPPAAAAAPAAAPPSVQELLARSEEVLRRIRERQSGSS